MLIALFTDIHGNREAFEACLADVGRRSIDRFVKSIPRAHLVVMVTYHVGQALIVAGVLAATG